MEIFMRRSFVFTALAVSALVAAPALAQTGTGTEPATPGTAPSVEAPAANMPEQPAQKTQHHRRHHKSMQSSSAGDETGTSTRHHRRGKSSSSAAEEEQTRQLNQQQLSGAAAPSQAPGQTMQPGQAMPGQSMEPGATDQTAPSTGE
jgi:hypothetical protein